MLRLILASCLLLAACAEAAPRPATPAGAACQSPIRRGASAILDSGLSVAIDGFDHDAGRIMALTPNPTLAPGRRWVAVRLLIRYDGDAPSARVDRAQFTLVGSKGVTYAPVTTTLPVQLYSADIPRGSATGGAIPYQIAEDDGELCIVVRSNATAPVYLAVE